MRGYVADVISLVKFCVNRFRRFGGITPPNLAIFRELSGGSYKSVSTTVLHCDDSVLVSVPVTSFICDDITAVNNNCVG